MSRLVHTFAWPISTRDEVCELKEERATYQKERRKKNVIVAESRPDFGFRPRGSSTRCLLVRRAQHFRPSREPPTQISYRYVFLPIPSPAEADSYSFIVASAFWLLFLFLFTDNLCRITISQAPKKKDYALSNISRSFSL